MEATPSLMPAITPYQNGLISQVLSGAWPFFDSMIVY